MHGYSPRDGDGVGVGGSWRGVWEGAGAVGGGKACTVVMHAGQCPEIMRCCNCGR